MVAPPRSGGHGPRSIGATVRLLVEHALGIEGVVVVKYQSQRDQIIKSVSLCEHTNAIREKRIPANFSRWVREQLKELENQKREYHVNVIGEGFLRFCNPFHAKGLCAMCWPNGPPIRADWLEYVRLSSYNRAVGKPQEELSQPEPASVKAESVSTDQPKQKGHSNAARYLSWLGWLLLAVSQVV